MSRMRILARDEGVVWVTPETDADASEIGSYWNAVRRYRRTGDDSDLWPFESEQIAGHAWETDLDAIDFWAATGELDFEDIYEDIQDQEEG
jgi:hypothetical protein